MLVRLRAAAKAILGTRPFWVPAQALAEPHLPRRLPKPHPTTAFAGRRVLVLMEEGADPRPFLSILDSAAHVDVLFQGRGAPARLFPGHAVFHWLDNQIDLGSEDEIACGEQSFAAMRQLTAAFAEMLPAPYAAHAETFAVFCEPVLYRYLFVIPRIIDRLLASVRPDAVAVLRGSGTTFAGCLGMLAERLGTDKVWFGGMVGPGGAAVEAVAAPLRPSPGGSGHARDSAGELALGLDRMSARCARAGRRTMGKIAGGGLVVVNDAKSTSYTQRYRPHLLEALNADAPVRLLLIDPSRKVLTQVREECRAAGMAPPLAFHSACGWLQSLLSWFLADRRAVWAKPLAQGVDGDWAEHRLVGLMPLLVERVVRAMEYVGFARHGLPLLRPDWVLGITGEAPKVRSVLEVATSQNIETIDMQLVAMADDPRNRVALLPKAKHFLALDRASMEILVRWGWPREHMIPCGLPGVPGGTDPIEAAEARFRGRCLVGAGDGRQVVLLVSQAQLHSHVDGVLTVLTETLAQRLDVHLVVKLHPREASDNRRGYERRLKDALPQGNWSVVSDLSMDVCLDAADVVVGIYSLSLIEAACRNKRVIAANLSGSRLPEPLNFGERGFAADATSPEALASFCHAFLDQTDIARVADLARDHYINQNMYLGDGDWTKRVIQYIRQAVPRGDLQS